MTPDDGKPLMPTITPTDGATTRKIVANLLAVVGAFMVLLGCDTRPRATTAW